MPPSIFTWESCPRRGWVPWRNTENPSFTDLNFLSWRILMMNTGIPIRQSVGAKFQTLLTYQLPANNMVCVELCEAVGGASLYFHHLQYFHSWWPTNTTNLIACTNDMMNVLASDMYLEIEFPSTNLLQKVWISPLRSMESNSSQKCSSTSSPSIFSVQVTCIKRPSHTYLYTIFHPSICFIDSKQITEYWEQAPLFSICP